MHLFSLGVAWLVAAAIIVIGLMYLTNPRSAALSFGLPLPEAGPNIAWWLRLKGVRDVTSGLIMIAAIWWGSSLLLGIVLLVEALTPVGDMTLVLLSDGSKKTALTVHAPTAGLMIIAGLLLVASGA